MIEENQKSIYSLNIKDEQAAKQPLEDDIKNLDNYEAVSTDKYYMNTTKVMNILKKQNYLFDSEISVSLRSKKGENTPTATFTLSNPQDEALIDQWDGNIYDAISTLVSAGNEFLSIDQIYRELNGFTGSQKASKATRDELNRRMQKLKNIEIDADFSAHYTLNKIQEGIMSIEEAPLLYFEKATKKLNGVIVDGYLFPMMPVLYRYANDVKHVKAINKELLNLSHDSAKTEHRASNTTDRGLINTHCIEMIHVIRQTKQKTGVIKLQGVYEMLERVHQKELSDKQKKTVRESLNNIILPQLIDKRVVKAAKLNGRQGKISIEL